MLIIEIIHHEDYLRQMPLRKKLTPSKSPTTLIYGLTAPTKRKGDLELQLMKRKTNERTAASGGIGVANKNAGTGSESSYHGPYKDVRNAAMKAAQQYLKIKILTPFITRVDKNGR